MTVEIVNRVKDFVLKQAVVFEEEVTEDASIENDLGVYGDDAVEFIVAFGKEFNVDVSKFMAADYFSGEGWSFFERTRKDFKVRHLIKAVLAGRLDEEVINS